MVSTCSRCRICYSLIYTLLHNCIAFPCLLPSFSPPFSLSLSPSPSLSSHVVICPLCLLPLRRDYECAGWTLHECCRVLLVCCLFSSTYEERSRRLTKTILILTLFRTKEMASRCAALRSVSKCYRMSIRAVSVGELGSGAGKSGGTGGSIRDAGGAFGRMEVAREEQYFRNFQKEQLKALREHLRQEIEHHEVLAKTHEDAIERHKRRIAELEAEEQRIE
ncbi:ATPase inhibitor mai-2, mitochondrial [Toxocara canis]|uniref:ATP synthase F1 subunit epsilon n=1 Tax=Toxocara canis TaxID=6265 RepID=A0A0B2V027_TOXCA|nr:ATPase inhibitor mai-2, mitochondrial [Toxocara canis]